VPSQDVGVPFRGVVVPSRGVGMPSYLFQLKRNFFYLELCELMSPNMQFIKETTLINDPLILATLITALL